MLKKVIFRKTNTILDSQKNIELSFESGVNIIIGPKGGGKSTLFDLLAGLSQKYIVQSVIDALKAYGLEFYQAEYDNGETIDSQQLLKKNKKDKEIDYANRNDVIYQDDPIKKDINNLAEIEKQKHQYIKDLISTSEVVSKFTDLLHDFYLEMEKINNLRNQKEINWSTTFSFVGFESNKFKLLIDLNYREQELDSKLKKERDNIQNISENAKNQINQCNMFSRFEFVEIYDDKTFNESLKKNFETMFILYKDLNNTLQNRITFLNKLASLNSSFKKAYSDITNKIKQDDFKGNGLKIYEKQAQDYFKDVANTVHQLKSKFNILVNKPLIFSFNDAGRQDDNNLLLYKIKDQVVLEQNVLYDLLKIILPAPGNAVNDINKWIQSVVKNDFKEFNQNKLLNKLSKSLEEHVIVYADNMNYDTMSLGQKSIFGIKYKYERSKQQDLYLDQPEDNLDNFTIANNIIEMIKSKPINTQVFIVTHNANIGILCDVRKVIVADLANTAKPQYTHGTLVLKDGVDSDTAHYLEGGSNNLSKRYQIILGEK